LRQLKKFLSDSIVVGISLAGDALLNAALVKGLAERQRSVLDAVVTVKDEARRGTFPANRHFQSACGQRGVKAARAGITNNLLLTWVFDDGGIKPTLICVTSLRTNPKATKTA